MTPTDPRTGQPYTSELARRCHERFLRKRDEAIDRWQTIPLAERIALYEKHRHVTPAIDPECDVDRLPDEEWKDAGR